MIGLSVAVSTVFLRDKLGGLTAGVTVVLLFGGLQSNLWVSIDFAHQYPRNQLAGNRTWVRIPPSPPKETTAFDRKLSFLLFSYLFTIYSSLFTKQAVVSEKR